MNKQFCNNMIAGGISGFISLGVIYPSEHIKTQLQMNSKQSILSCFKNTIKNDGIKSLYNGFLPLASGIVPRFACKFGFYKTTSGYLNNYLSPNVNSFVSGFISGALTSCIVSSPTENIKTRIIYNQLHNKNTSMLNAIKDLYKQGIHSFYKGNSSTLIKEGSTFGFRFFVFNYTNNLLQTKFNFKNNPYTSAISGGLCGIIGSVLNHPLDVIQTKLQSNYNKKYNGVIDCFKKSIKENGIKELYTGVLIRTLRTIPGMSVTFFTYDVISSFLEN